MNADAETQDTSGAPVEGGEMSQDDAISKLAEMMKEKGIATAENVGGGMQAAFLLGKQSAIMHESCAEPGCQMCGIRNKIQDDAFRRGLEKGAKLAMMGRSV